jgi:hypothetical protein
LVIGCRRRYVDSDLVLDGFAGLETLLAYVDHGGAERSATRMFERRFGDRFAGGGD